VSDIEWCCADLDELSVEQEGLSHVEPQLGQTHGDQRVLVLHTARQPQQIGDLQGPARDFVCPL
jgi:hypothetical protein